MYITIITRAEVCLYKMYIAFIHIPCEIIHNCILRFSYKYIYIHKFMTNAITLSVRYWWYLTKRYYLSRANFLARFCIIQK